MIGQRFVERRCSGNRNYHRRVVATAWISKRDGFGEYQLVYYQFLDGSKRRSCTGSKTFLKRFEPEVGN